MYRMTSTSDYEMGFYVLQITNRGTGCRGRNRSIALEEGIEVLL